MLPLGRIAIVGTDGPAQAAAQALEPQRGSAEFVGFVGGPEDGASPLLGALDQIDHVVKGYGITHVLVPSRGGLTDLARVVDRLRGLSVAIVAQPDLADLTFGKVELDLLGHTPVLTLKTSGLGVWQRLSKRATDLGLMLISLPITLPTALAAAAAIKLDSPGPVLYRQWRIGEGGRLFTLYKFRSMVANAPPNVPGEIKTRHDPRVTRVGRLLRTTSLDELPQLWNVLRGDMSLVGPRPDVPELVARYDGWQYQRLSVPQGLTGWWQINGRAERPMQQHIEDDLYYVQHYSLWFDLVILARTVLAVLSRRGAY